MKSMACLQLLKNYFFQSSRPKGEILKYINHIKIPRRITVQTQ
jgi:hypothetical protein